MSHRNSVSHTFKYVRLVSFASTCHCQCWVLPKPSIHRTISREWIFLFHWTIQNGNSRKTCDWLQLHVTRAPFWLRRGVPCTLLIRTPRTNRRKFIKCDGREPHNNFICWTQLPLNNNATDFYQLEIVVERCVWENSLYIRLTSIHIGMRVNNSVKWFWRHVTIRCVRWKTHESWASIQRKTKCNTWDEMVINDYSFAQLGSGGTQLQQRRRSSRRQRSRRGQSEYFLFFTFIRLHLWLQSISISISIWKWI